MDKAAEDRREPKKQDRPAEPPLVGEDGDVYFFNPWDRHFEADMKPRTHKFEF